MPARFTVLASGSSGNASLLEVSGFCLLIDCGVGPRVLAGRLVEAGRSWGEVSAVLLTHTHGDHWNALTLAHLRSLKIPLFAHARHHEHLAGFASHDPLRKAKLVREYGDGPFRVGPGFIVKPVEVPHDSYPTFAFRFESDCWALGYASDLGRVTDDLLDALAGVDVLALEYNHDVALQKASRRPQLLINRVLGDHGHLSNDQAKDFTRAIAATANLQALIQLHLSRECNQPKLAKAAGRRAVSGITAVITAGPFQSASSVTVADRSLRFVSGNATSAVRSRNEQPSLPGL